MDSLSVFINIVCGIVLIVCTIDDILKKTINVLFPLVGSVVIVSIRMICFGEDISVVISSLVPGITILCMAATGCFGIGAGDGFIICFIGACFELSVCLLIILYGFAMAWFRSIVGFISGYYTSKADTIPFVPYVTVGWIVCLLQTVNFVNE
ncbi:MAG: hypothetical protein E7265_06295 [Lachnospiraceae bacterium]|nr:hypothetical protein [Lachnospiraceae bacterium]